MSSKSSHEAIVAQVTNSRTSRRGYMTRQDSRSSPSSEKWCNSRPNRARGISSSMIVSAKVSMIALHANQSAQGITTRPSTQNHPTWPVNLSSEPWALSPVELTQALLDRAALLDPKINAYLLVTPDLALKQARLAEREIMADKHRG